ncbi:MAG: hypothetical protein CVU39_15095 [Chloroflexi bacterium HGW-Chloroflexi-10]|nr:MAG: hypothetical protein CVU39_15095 [Chloroflexi bacterium HGW-Chloroflexi-10]
MQLCPICSSEIPENPRYPQAVCHTCAAQAVSLNDRPVCFYNIDFSGGFRGEYADTHEPYPLTECFIRGVKCSAQEARFGGIVIQVAQNAM